MTAASAYPDYDGMTVYFRPPTPEVEAQNVELLAQRTDQNDSQQCAADSSQSPVSRLSTKLQSKLSGRVSGKLANLLDRARQDNKSVVEVIKMNAKTMTDLNRQGKECKVM